MKVNDFDRYILSYLDEDLSSSKAEDFEKIMEDNPECKEKFINHQNIVKGLSNIDNLNAPEGFSNRLYAKIDEISPGFIDRNRLNKKINSLNSNNSIENSFFQYNYMPIVRIAAGLAIFVFSVSIFFNSNNMSNSDSNRSLSATGSINSSDMADNSEDSKLDSTNNVDIPLEYENSVKGSIKYVKHKK